MKDGIILIYVDGNYNGAKYQFDKLLQMEPRMNDDAFFCNDYGFVVEKIGDINQSIKI